jgi:hypothetical protein
MNNWARMFLMCALVFLVWGQCFGSTPFPGGDDWSAWSNDTRISYISTYMFGYARGFRDACETGQEIYSNDKLPRAPRDKCFERAYKYSKNLEDYAEKITAYYREFPNDRKVPVFKLIEGLSDSRNLTLQKMHEYYGSSQERLSE